MDCRPGELCHYNECVSQKELDNAGTSYVLQVDLFGFLLFGPTVSGEMGVGVLNMAPLPVGNVSLRAWYRHIPLGLLSTVIIADEASDEELESAYGVGLGGRLFFHPLRPSGLFVGGGLEYVSTVVEDRVDDLAIYESSGVVVQGECGFRWISGGFVVGTSAGMGMFLSTDYDARPSEEGGCRYEGSCPSDTDSSFYFSATAEVGVLFR